MQLEKPVGTKIVTSFFKFIEFFFVNACIGVSSSLFVSASGFSACGLSGLSAPPPAAAADDTTATAATAKPEEVHSKCAAAG